MTICKAAEKRVNFKHVEGPVGVRARNFRIDKISSIGWKSRFSLKEGIARTYPWIKEHVDAHKND